MRETAAKGNGMLRPGDSRDILVTEWEIEKETIMFFKMIYRQIWEYLKESEIYFHPQSGDMIIEDLYWERWEPSGEKSQWIWWRFLIGTGNPFLHGFCSWDYQTLYVRDKDKAYKGKKVPQSAITDLFIRAKFYLQFDRDDKFKNSIVWKFRRAFFNRIYYQEIQQIKSTIYQHAMDLNRLCKGILEAEADREWTTTSYGKLGYKEWGDDWDTELKP